jgi:hypothetical protein
MRISADKADPGYRYEATGWRYHATINGKPVKRCITADSDKGYVIKLALGPGGKYMIKGKVRRTRVFGAVAIFKNGERIA